MFGKSLDRQSTWWLQYPMHDIVKIFKASIFTAKKLLKNSKYLEKEHCLKNLKPFTARVQSFVNRMISLRKSLEGFLLEHSVGT